MYPLLEVYEDRIWTKVVIPPDVSQCWTWTGGTQQGYGVIQVRNLGQFKVHRMVATMFHGLPVDGQMALHKCNNKDCVNPGHLYWGSAKDNRRDHLRALGFDHV